MRTTRSDATSTARLATEVAAREADITAALSRIVVEIRLLEMLDEACQEVADRFGAAGLIIDRTLGPDLADAHALLDDGSMLDLWDLDPLLWDEVRWAALRYVAEGELTVIRRR